jgi:CubicO group peptidase (beta-lactamase class C family)
MKITKNFSLIALSGAIFFSVIFAGCSDDKKNSSSSGSILPNLYSSSMNSSSPSSTSDLMLDLKIDNEISNIMAKTGATAVTVAIAKHGVIKFEKAYGFKDAKKTIPLKSDALLRTASIVKPITAAAIRKLANDDVLSLSDHVFCMGDNAPCWLPSTLLSSATDPRVKDITIQQLIDHRGGRSRNHDPFGGEAQCKAVSAPCPPSRIDIVKYMMTLPLDYSPGFPGNLDGYSNFGYLLLGMIIEQASQTSYTQYVQNSLMKPLGISSNDFKAGESLPADHDEREPIYISKNMAPSVFNIGKEAPFAEEGFVAKNWLAVGSSISTARAMTLFASAYKLPHGEVLEKNATNDGIHLGGVDGSATIVRQLSSGVSYSIFLNIAISSEAYSSLRTPLDEASKLIL